ncbi:putative single-stranded DNA binding protein P9 [Basidiobolus meristosporus CBS 931.73]|uniref:Putative single-stranded DNA binding protein P9 n=1 Tax=Basidiobolus meristosporus CBS 931.73 TaxID=1314790 RepID=A0A1Y1YTM3_9FUNG|nr:putative single-stranded DNA binding protein P9 [Basidiobolus meristosporus CBS 931.73]|eukprot:ORY01390.1 putative single-stranded DNA binding protein P9 [Basidiobolus meristosporus CBS 931.73]
MSKRSVPTEEQDTDYKADLEIESEDEQNETSKNKKAKTTTGNSKVNDDGEQYFELSSKKRLSVRKWKNMVLVDFREFFTDSNGVVRPTKKGITLSLDQWKKLKELANEVDDAIDQL